MLSNVQPQVSRSFQSLEPLQELRVCVDMHTWLSLCVHTDWNFHFYHCFSEIYINQPCKRTADMIIEHLWKRLCSSSDVPAKPNNDLQLICSHDKILFLIKKKVYLSISRSKSRKILKYWKDKLFLLNLLDHTNRKKVEYSTSFTAEMSSLLYISYYL